MKTIVITLSLISMITISLAQGAVVRCEAATQRYINSHYTVAEELELKQSPEKLECMNYIMAHSYAFTKDQMVLNSQKMMFNIDQYKQLRKKDSRTVVYDEATGLTVELFSFDEVDKALDQIHARYELAQAK